MANEEYSKLDSEYSELYEEVEGQTTWYRNLDPKKIAVLGLIFVLVLQFVIKVNPYITMAFGAATFIFTIFLSSQTDTKQKYIDCYTAMAIIRNDLNKKKEFVEDLKKGKWAFTNINIMKEWNGQPWRWYINFTLRKDTGKLEYWHGIVDPWTATIKGYHKLDKQVDVDKVSVNTKVFIPFQQRGEIAIKKDIPYESVGKF